MSQIGEFMGKSKFTAALGQFAENQESSETNIKTVDIFYLIFFAQPWEVDQIENEIRKIILT